MALFRSARRGDRVMTTRNWIRAYALIWLLPVPLGIILSAFAVLLRLPFELLEAEISAETAISVIFGLGVFLILMPIFSWTGLVLSFPILWLVLRLGLGGLVTFALGGVLAATMSSVALGGMAIEIPIVFGILSALTFRWLLLRRTPEIFVPSAMQQNGGV